MFISGQMTVLIRSLRTLRKSYLFLISFSFTHIRAVKRCEHILNVAIALSLALISMSHRLFVHFVFHHFFDSFSFSFSFAHHLSLRFRLLFLIRMDQIKDRKQSACVRAALNKNKITGKQKQIEKKIEMNFSLMEMAFVTPVGYYGICMLRARACMCVN